MVERNNQGLYEYKSKSQIVGSCVSLALNMLEVRYLLLIIQIVENNCGIDVLV